MGNVFSCFSNCFRVNERRSIIVSNSPSSGSVSENEEESRLFQAQESGKHVTNKNSDEACRAKRTTSDGQKGFFLSQHGYGSIKLNASVLNFSKKSLEDSKPPENEEVFPSRIRSSDSEEFI